MPKLFSASSKMGGKLENVSKAIDAANQTPASASSQGARTKMSALKTKTTVKTALAINKYTPASGIASHDGANSS